LVIEDYGLVADTPATHLTGKQQVQNINVMAQKGDKKNTYYYWELSPYTKGTQALDELPKYLYRMTQVTQLMDGVRELVENYRTFLLKKEFQSFLLRCLDKVSGEIAQLDAHVDEADQCLDESKSVSRGLMDILRNLTKALDASLEGFRGAMVDFKKVVSAPDFIKKQHLRLNMKVSKVAEQYQVLFNENSGLTDLLVLMDPSDEPQASSDETKLKKPLSQHVISPPDVHPALPNHLADPGQMRALKRTVKMCYDALSFQSRVGRKGLLLQKLLESIEHRSHVTEQYIKYVVMELTRVTASERETWFFQAEYGKTRSAKALMMAIKDSTINQALPLAVMILGQPVSDIAAVSEGQIIRRFKQLRASHSRWQESSHHMNIEPFQETLEDRKVGFSVR
jgi:hypothetical protein